jgi:ribosomal-protein-alanine N-acetyltransferase
MDHKREMDHRGTVRLETGRLVLRRFSAADAEAMFANWAADEKVTRHLTWPAHASVEATAAVLREWSASYARPDFYLWAIELAGTGEPIGSIGATVASEGAFALEVGYALGAPWWGRGIMSEAFAAVIDFLFGEVGAGRIEARHSVANERSGRVMRRCGMTYEGTLRQAGVTNEGVVDVCVYGLLRGEWEGLRQELSGPGFAPEGLQREFI